LAEIPGGRVWAMCFVAVMMDNDIVMNMVPWCWSVLLQTHRLRKNSDRDELRRWVRCNDERRWSGDGVHWCSDELRVINSSLCQQL